MEIKIKAQLQGGVSNSFLVYDNKNFVVTYESLWGIFTIGCDLMMIDLDYKDPGVGDEETIIKRLDAYARYHNIAFAYRLSDRGIHAFVVSKKYDLNSDDDGNKIMFENHCEDRYIVFSKLRKSYNARIGPKPFEISSGSGPGAKLRTRAELSTEFLSKKPQFDILGDENLVDKDLYNLLSLNDYLVGMMYDTYQKDYDTVWSKTKKHSIDPLISNHINTVLNPRIETFCKNRVFYTRGIYPCDYKGKKI